jgi:hypothetical protein
VPGKRRIIPIDERYDLEPDLRQHIWRIFEIDGDSENNLAGRDKFSTMEASWGNSLRILSERGMLSRQRLLDESLAALNRGFAQFRAGWFSRFHEFLEPTVQEMQQRLDAYGNLLASPIGPTVSFALKAIVRCDKEEPIRSEFLLRYLPPALASNSKATVSMALSLVERAVKREPNFAVDGCLLIAEGLMHQSPDVQNKIMDSIDRFGLLQETRVRDKVMGYAEFLSPSIKARLGLKVGDVAPIGLNRNDRTAVAEDMRSGRSLIFSPERHLEPVVDIEQLISLASFCLEHPEESGEIERLMDAVSRLLPEHADHIVAAGAPLKKQASKVLEEEHWSYNSDEHFRVIRQLVAAFVYSVLVKSPQFLWSKLERLPGQLRPNRLEPAVDYLRTRLSEILARIFSDSASLPLLSCPTHFGGWIEPSILLARLQAWEASTLRPGGYDQATALFRLPLPIVAELMPDLPHQPGEFWSAVRYACRLSDAKGEQDSPLWTAANIYREPPEPGSEVYFGEGRIFMGGPRALLRWQAILFPSLRELFIDSGMPKVSRAIDWMDVSARVSSAYLELLVDQAFPLGPNAIKMLAAGLFIGDPELSGYSRDALILSIENGTLDHETLGQELCTIVYSASSKPARLAKSLGEVSRIGPRHADAVRKLLQRALHGCGEAPRSLLPVLELLHELLIAAKAELDDDITIEHLKTIKTAGRTSKLIKAILHGKQLRN